MGVVVILDLWMLVFGLIFFFFCRKGLEFIFVFGVGVGFLLRLFVVFSLVGEILEILRGFEIGVLGIIVFVVVLVFFVIICCFLLLIVVFLGLIRFLLSFRGVGVLCILGSLLFVLWGCLL